MRQAIQELVTYHKVEGSLGKCFLSHWSLLHGYRHQSQNQTAVCLLLWVMKAMVIVYICQDTGAQHLILRRPAGNSHCKTRNKTSTCICIHHPAGGPDQHTRTT